MLEDNNLADVPIVIAAIDPCFSCTDRSIRVNDLSSNRTDRLTWPELRARGIEWYRREAAVDFSHLNQALGRALEAR
jgi:membrane-bound hydrogenase subunit alpha